MGRGTDLGDLPPPSHWDLLGNRVATLGLGIDGVASVIGVLGGKRFLVKYDKLLDGLCSRFGATRTEAELAIERAKKAGVVKVSRGNVRLLGVPRRR